MSLPLDISLWPPDLDCRPSSFEIYWSGLAMLKLIPTPIPVSSEILHWQHLNIVKSALLKQDFSFSTKYRGVFFGTVNRFGYVNLIEATKK